jgi:hypothetical protein
MTAENRIRVLLATIRARSQRVTPVRYAAALQTAVCRKIVRVETFQRREVAIVGGNFVIATRRALRQNFVACRIVNRVSQIPAECRQWSALAGR